MVAQGQQLKCWGLLFDSLAIATLEFSCVALCRRCLCFHSPCSRGQLFQTTFACVTATPRP